MDNPFTFDSDEMFAAERLDRALLEQGLPTQSDPGSSRGHRPPVFVVTSRGVELLDSEVLSRDFVAPLIGAYELPVTMISLRLLEANTIYVTVFDGGSSMLHAVRIEGVHLDGLRFEDYRRARSGQDSEHVS
ncbi:MAG: hypothetical protein ACRDHF_07235 [Tepidiformaceae bacterium]